jgi:AraC-like DNA-binding protein
VQLLFTAPSIFIVMTAAGTQESTKIAIGNTRSLEEFRAWISNHLDEEHSIAGLAAQAKVSASWLQRSFKKAYGYSVFTCIRYERLLRAQKQLEVTPMTIKMISSQARYKSVPAFTAAFSHVFGITPARYRKGSK